MSSLRRGLTSTLLSQAVRRSAIYQLAAELWLILRWLVLKVIAITVYAALGRTDSAEHVVIRFGNWLFLQKYSCEMYRDFASYVKCMPPSLDEYLGICDRQQWLDGRTILDLGSGLGQYSLALRELGASRVVALECQSDKATWAGKLLGSRQGIEVVVGLGEEIPYEDGTFDTVFSHTVFEHISDVEGALRSARRVLKRSGQIILSYNYLHHPYGHHLFPYIHFPWATWVVRETALCDYWSEKLWRAQGRNEMLFYARGARIRTLSEGDEIHLNRLTFDEFEQLVERAGLQIEARRPSGALLRLMPQLGRIAMLKYFLTGTVYYVLRPRKDAKSESCSPALQPSAAA